MQTADADPLVPLFLEGGPYQYVYANLGIFQGWGSGPTAPTLDPLMTFELRLHELLSTTRKMMIHRGWGGAARPLENHKNIGYLSNTGPDSLKNHKATKSTIIGPPAKRHLMALFGFSLLSQ